MTRGIIYQPKQGNTDCVFFAAEEHNSFKPSFCAHHLQPVGCGIALRMLVIVSQWLHSLVVRTFCLRWLAVVSVFCRIPVWVERFKTIWSFAQFKCC